MEARKSEDVVGVRDVKQVLLGRENVFIHHLPRTVPRVLLDASKKLEAQSTIFTLISTQALKTGETLQHIYMAIFLHKFPPAAIFLEKIIGDRTIQKNIAEIC